ncbi:MAG: peptidase and subtilisin kexin sedolisin [Ignavibacteria bacterium]|nr:peptidase and subtilisin kexin sedolisin [Ignavibacteria bacterium]
MKNVRSIHFPICINTHGNFSNLQDCHSERSEESSIHALYRFYTILRIAVNDIYQLKERRCPTSGRCRTSILLFIVLFSSIVILFSSNNLFCKSGNNSIIIKLRSASSIGNVLIHLGLKNSKFKQIFPKINSDKNGNSLLSSEQNKDYNELRKYFVLNFTDEASIPAAWEKLRSNPDIIRIDKNVIYHIDTTSVTPNDTYYKDQWAIKAIGADKAWLLSTGKDVLVGVIDTGIEYDHPDLKKSLWINPKEDLNQNGTFEPWTSTDTLKGITGDLNGKDDDGNGYSDDVIGYDFVDESIANVGDDRQRDAVPTDNHGHGTIVSGVIAAQNNNGIGITGIAFDAKIVTLRALDAVGGGQSSDIASAIIYAALNGIKILNCSFGEYSDSPILHEAVKFAYASGCVIIGSSGNDGASKPHYPSDYDEVIGVGASTIKNQRASFSNFNSRLALLAPGSEIKTTAMGGAYKETAGTSLAAPHISAVSAMIRQLNPLASPEDIKGILEASATGFGDGGWNIEAGAGILNAEAALNIIGGTHLYISTPKNNQVFNRKNQTTIPVTGSIATPLFNNYLVLIGKGIDPVYVPKRDLPDTIKQYFNLKPWDTLNIKTNSQIIDGKLAEIPVDNYSDSVYTIRVIVNLKNFHTIEFRKYIEIASEKTRIKIDSLIILYPIFNGKRILLAAAQTSSQCLFSVRFRPLNSNSEFKEISEYETSGRFHSITAYDLQPGIVYEAEAVAVRTGCDSVINKFNFTLPQEGMPSDKFIQQGYSLPPENLLNKVSDFYHDGYPCIAVNEMASALWGPTKIYQFKDNKFIQRDSTPNLWIPVGMGDSNGDGIMEVFAKSSGKSVLFQASIQSGNPFSNKIFSDTVYHNFWAAGMYDFDRNGNPELIASSDTSYLIYTFMNNRYELMTMALDSNRERKHIGTLPGLAIGDFDGDGNIELCFGNRSGDIMFYEFSKGALNLEFIDSSGNSDENFYISTVDIDGNGIPEILIGSIDSSLLPNENDNGVIIWKYRIFQKIGTNSYKSIWTDYVYGVRSGIDYRNGVSAGNLDKEPGDEIVLMPFPNLYILKWDKKNQNMKPLYWNNNAFSNSAVIYDFNNNGVNEIGFNTGNETVFYEFNAQFQGPSAPTSFDGWATSDSTAFFQWYPSPDAEGYEIDSLRFEGKSVFADPVGQTTSNTINIENLGKNKFYSFVIRSYNSNMTDFYSQFSLLDTNIVKIYTHNPLFAQSAEFQNGNRLLVKYTGKLGNKTLEPALFELLDVKKEFLTIAKSVVFGNDSSLIVTLPDFITEGQYILRCKSFRDMWRMPTKENYLPLELSKQQKEIFLYLKSLEVISRTQLLVEFSEPTEQQTAEQISNYMISPYGKIIKVNQKQSNPAQVSIELEPSELIAALGKTYTLTVKNVKSNSEHLMTTGAGNSLSFLFTSPNGDDAFAYPNPIKLGDANHLTFAQIPSKCEVVVITIQGELIARLKEIDGNGGVDWDLHNRNGNLIDPGIYLFYVRETKADGSTVEYERRKFAVVR